MEMLYQDSLVISTALQPVPVLLAVVISTITGMLDGKDFHVLSTSN